MELLIEPVNLTNDVIICNSAESQQVYTISNVSIFSAPIYVWRNPAIGAENNSFLRVYDGNVTIEDDEIAVVILKSNEGAHYIITPDSLNLSLKIN